MKAFHLTDEQSKLLLAELRRLQLLTRGEGDEREILFWGGDDWAVVMRCMIEAGILHTEERTPYTQFLLFLQTNQVALRETELIDAKTLSRTYVEIQDEFPWRNAERGKFGHCLPRWRMMHDYLVPRLKHIVR